jgi:two-component system cell cycle sensor histidine kinase/response regulator CckA
LRQVDAADNPTHTIDLDRLQVTRVTESGSFDLTQVSHDSFGRLLQALSVPTLLITRTYSIAFANAAFFELAGAELDLSSTTFASFFRNPKEAQEAQLLLNEVFEHRKPRVKERILRIHGSRIWARIHLRTIRLGGEQLVLAQIENLTAQKQLRTVQKYKKLVNIFPLGMAELTTGKPLDLSLPDGQLLENLLKARIVDGNSEFAQMYNRKSATDLRGLRLGVLFPYRGKGKEVYDKWCRAGFPAYTFDTKEKLLNVASRYFENTLIGNVSRNRLLGLWWLKRDISERKRAEHEALRSQKLESLGVLAGGIAHDFNNLLTGILGNISLAKASLPPGHKAAQRLETAAAASTRAQELTRQLLTFSQGGAPIKKIASIGELLKDSVTFATRGSRVRCEFAVPENLWHVDVDVGQIDRVINNLVINAVQAMPHGGVLTIEAANLRVTGSPGLPLKKGEYVRISIKDTGIGIRQEYLQKIFDPYFTTKEKGTGLGLASAYSVIRKHDGLMTVESEIGVGSTFTFYLPATPDAIAAEQWDEEKSLRGRGTILVMDDDVMILDLAGELLATLGYEAAFAKNGEEAVAMYKDALSDKRPFDAVVMDLTIPGGIGGKETMERLLEIDPDAKAIVSSGYSNDPIMAEHEKHGFVGALPKPYNINDVGKLLRRICCSKEGK